jgi:hypothetical protein
MTGDSNPRSKLNSPTSKILDIFLFILWAVVGSISLAWRLIKMIHGAETIRCFSLLSTSKYLPSMFPIQFQLFHVSFKKKRSSNNLCDFLSEGAKGNLKLLQNLC